MLKNLPSEWKIIREICDRFWTNSPDILLGIGDDAFVFQAQDEKITISQDALVETVHFDRKYFSPLDLAHKILAVNLSDLVSKGAIPRYVFLTLALPSDIDVNWVKEFFEELAGLCRAHQVALAGGDLTRSPGPIMLDMNALGICPINPIPRSGAENGDLLMVSGPLGLSHLGLLSLTKNISLPSNHFQRLHTSHLRPKARTDLLPFLHKNRGLIHASIDVSDGLINETYQILKSRPQLGAIIDYDHYIQGWNDQDPQLVSTMTEAAEIHGTKLSDAIFWGGEDYELLCAVPKAAAELFQKHHWLVVGEITEKYEGIYLKQDSQIIPIQEYAGFQHFA
jgi:thiamine-monophosphate kinase